MNIMTMYQIVKHLEKYGNVAIDNKVLNQDEVQRFVKKQKLFVRSFENGHVVLEVTRPLSYSQEWFEAKETEDRINKYNYEHTTLKKLKGEQ